MAESYLVRRGAGGGGSFGSLAIYTGESVPSSQPYGIFANTGTRTVNNIVVEMPIDSELSLITYTTPYVMRGLSINEEETQGLYQYYSSYVMKYDLTSNLSTQLGEQMALVPSSMSKMQHVSGSLYNMAYVNATTLYTFSIDADTGLRTQISTYSGGVNASPVLNSKLLSEENAVQLRWYPDTRFHPADILPM